MWECGGEGGEAQPPNLPQSFKVPFSTCWVFIPTPNAPKCALLYLYCSFNEFGVVCIIDDGKGRSKNNSWSCGHNV